MIPPPAQMSFRVLTVADQDALLYIEYKGAIRTCRGVTVPQCTSMPLMQAEQHDCRLYPEEATTDRGEPLTLELDSLGRLLANCHPLENRCVFTKGAHVAVVFKRPMRIC